MLYRLDDAGQPVDGPPPNWPEANNDAAMFRAVQSRSLEAGQPVDTPPGGTTQTTWVQADRMAFDPVPFPRHFDQKRRQEGAPKHGRPFLTMIRHSQVGKPGI